MNIDIWQLMGSLAAGFFTLGFVDQLRLTLKTKDVDGLSLIQWFLFAAASAIFMVYYGHLDQWLMFSVSVFGTICCLSVFMMILKYRKVPE